jgi:hypothetical protein
MQLHRRGFIQLMGGGVIAAAAPLGACAAGPDQDPARWWRHPGQGESDLRRRVLSYALLAPNPHNMQPWKADLRAPGEITLHMDLDRLLPVTDPFNRQIVIGTGAFLELLSLAAAQEGLTAMIELFPQGEPEPLLDHRPVARIRLEPGARPDPLFAHALRRRTNRLKYDAQPVDPAAAKRIAAAGTSGAVQGQAALAPDQLKTLRALASEGAMIEASTPAANDESARLTFFGPGEVAQHPYGVSISSPVVGALHGLGLISQRSLMKPGSFGFRAEVDMLRQGAETAQGFLWLTTPGNSRSEQIAAGRAYLRACLQTTSEGLAMQPYSQVLQEYPTMAASLSRAQRLLAPGGGRVQMFVRLGHAKAVPASPRRGLEPILVRV